MTLALVIAPSAEADIDDILEWSAFRFDPAIRDGYEALIDAAITQLLDEPERPGSHTPDRLRGQVRTYHLAAARDAVPGDVRRIEKPRHFVIYRVVGSELHVVRILHDALDLPRQYIP